MGFGFRYFIELLSVLVLLLAFYARVFLTLGGLCFVVRGSLFGGLFCAGLIGICCGVVFIVVWFVLGV